MMPCALFLQRSFRSSRRSSLLGRMNWWKLLRRAFDYGKECYVPTNGQRKKKVETQCMSSLFLNALANTRLYPLTDRGLSGLSHAEQVSHLSAAGATLIQLREKVLSSLQFYEEAAEALRVARESGVKIIINDRVDIALALQADGVHLGQDDLPPEAARELLGPDAIIGVSTHTLEQASISTKLPVDYIAIGPIFSTSTKQSSNLAVGVDGLGQIRRA